MGEAITRQDPSSVIADKLLSKDASNTLLPIRAVRKALTWANGTGNGSLINWQNPEDVEVLASVLIRITTAGTGTAGVDIGVGGNATASNDNLLDGALVNTLDFVKGVGSLDLGTNGRVFILMDEKGGTNDYIVGKANDVDASAAGIAYIIYIPVS